LRYLRVLIASFFFLTTACGPSSNNSDGEDLTGIAVIDGYEIEGAKVQLDLGVLSAQGTPASADVGSDDQQQAKTSRSQTRLASGSRLVALLDTECSAQNSSGLSRKIQERAFDKSHYLKHQAYSFTLDSDTPLDQLTRDAENDECVLQVSNDIEMHAVTVPNDPMFSKQWQHKAIESAAGWDIFFGSSGIQQDVIVAIVDTGVNYNHPDLQANMWTSSTGTHGKDFVNGDDNPMDDNGHGTHCAGLAGATGNNAIGVAGTMMSHVKIMAVKGLNSRGSGSTSTLVNGINYAIANGAKVISLSLGASGTSSLWKSTLNNAVNKGVVVVAAAGNDGTQISTNNFEVPAGYAKDIQGAMAIGSITSSLAPSSFSNYGPAYVELGSPGSNILSTYGSGYGTMSGTSMATPLAAGAAALTIGLLKSRGLEPTPALVESLMTEGSVKDPNLRSYFKDGNRLDLRTLAQLIDARYPANGETPPSSPPPEPTPIPTPAPTPPMSGPCGSMTGMACTVFQNINQQRINNGLAALKPHSNCVGMAQSHATDMAENNFFSHTSPTQGDFITRARRFGLTGSYGENIAYGYTPTSVVTAWMNSSGHRANILSKVYRSTGVGYATNAAGRAYYVQCFSSTEGN
jgi:uncharacterized protein YkwD